MPLLAGTVAFSRFRIHGGSPKRLDDRLLDKLRAQVIGERTGVVAGEEEIGWIGGRHLLDREFDLEKNILLDCLHFGMRVDTSRIPPDLLHAYAQQELDALLRDRPPTQPVRGRSTEATSAEEDAESHHTANGRSNGRGRTFAKLRKQAVDTARQRAAQEVKQGRYRRMQQVPILLDSRDDLLYLGATTPALVERLLPLFKETFDKRLEPLTAGSLAYQWAEARGLSRRIESIQPARFVEHPGGNGQIDVYWTAGDPNSRDFLGNEFLVWLWYTLAEETDTIGLADETEASLVIVKQLALECPWAESGKAVFSADGPASLPESRRALSTGKLPRKAGLIVSRQGEQYEFVLQAETLNVTSGVLPKLETNGNPRAYYEERLEQIRHLSHTIDLLYGAFLEKRTDAEWPLLHEKIRAWMSGTVARSAPIHVDQAAEVRAPVV